MDDDKEFNIAFLAALRRYKFELALQTSHECRDDLRIDGWEAVRERWSAFVLTEANSE